MNVIATRVIRVELAVKFRSFGVTLGTVRRSWALRMPPCSAMLADTDQLHFDERGVRLDVWVE